MIADYQTLIESALVYGGHTHTFADVVAAVEAGEAQFWPGPHSCIVTQIDEQPQRKVLVFWLAAGNSVELKAMEPGVVAWGKEEGCTLARMVGRRGWLKSWVMQAGWRDTTLVVLDKEIQ